MTPAQYWNDDPWLAKSFLEKHNIETERKNQEAWLHGFYVHAGIVVALHNALSKKGAKQQKYPDYTRITPLTETEKERKVFEERKKVINYFTNFEKAFNSNQKQRKEAANDNN